MSRKLSVVIPTKNRIDDLIGLVGSILNQSLIPDELVIIDQSDNSQAKIFIEDKWKIIRAPELIYILDPNIKGLTDAKRIGAITSSFELICFLDDDLILDSRFLEELIKPFENNSEMLGSSGVFINYTKRSRLYTAMYGIFHRGIFADPRPVFFKKYEGYDHALLASSVLWGGITVWRSEVLDLVPFDSEKLLFMMEDFYYSAKVIDVFGGGLFINPNARVVHNHSRVNRPSETDQESRKIFEYLAYYKRRRHKYFSSVHLIWLLSGLFFHVAYQSIKIGNVSLIKAFIKGIKMSKIS